jgi:hypothetical protein
MATSAGFPAAPTPPVEQPPPPVVVRDLVAVGMSAAEAEWVLDDLLAIFGAQPE